MMSVINRGQEVQVDSLLLYNAQVWRLKFSQNIYIFFTPPYYGVTAKTVLSSPVTIGNWEKLDITACGFERGKKGVWSDVHNTVVPRISWTFVSPMFLLVSALPVLLCLLCLSLQRFLPLLLLPGCSAELLEAVAARFHRRGRRRRGPLRQAGPWAHVLQFHILKEKWEEEKTNKKKKFNRTCKNRTYRITYRRVYKYLKTKDKVLVPSTHLYLFRSHRSLGLLFELVLVRHGGGWTAMVRGADYGARRVQRLHVWPWDINTDVVKMSFTKIINLSLSLSC